MTQGLGGGEDAPICLWDNKESRALSPLVVEWRFRGSLANGNFTSDGVGIEPVPDLADP